MVPLALSSDKSNSLAKSNSVRKLQLSRG